MKILFAIVFVLLSSFAHAEFQGWTTDEKMWGATAGVLLLGDWATTNNMTHRYNENYHENNPLLGKHPTSNTVNLYLTPFLATRVLPIKVLRIALLSISSIVYC